MFKFLCLTLFISFINISESKGIGAARLLCYTHNVPADDAEFCTHIVYAGKLRGEKLDAILKENKKKNEQAKIILRITEDEKNLKTHLKSRNIQGLEVFDAHRSLNKSAATQIVEDARTALSSIGGGPLFVHLPSNPELLAKYYDLKTLVKLADFMVASTDMLGSVDNMTYQPSRLSGMWDMLNTDSVVDLIVGLGVPPSKLVITLPATAFKFTLVNESLSTPGSLTMEKHPVELTQQEACQELNSEGGKWMVEREQDLSAPYAFRNTSWISFEDSRSVDVKGKYARVRGLAGLALMDTERDANTHCGPSLLSALNKVLNSQSRMPRGAVLRSLENEILAPASGLQFLEEVQVSPYRITQVVDSDGVIHSLREDTRTEFTCSRQGYFVHPRSCGRFYRCVKFDQTSPDYTVFEFDCPEGLAFDSRWEVCVWPGSLTDATACPGSAEIAPVPSTRFVCPEQEGYYVDPENCRWFFACIDHGATSLTAYEFRCPFGLGFDPARLLCDWPWLVPNCGNLGRYEAEVFGAANGKLTGATGFIGQTPESVNVAAHNNLLSGAALDNLVGVQGNLFTPSEPVSVSTVEPEVTGSLIKDDFREPNYVSQPVYRTVSLSTIGKDDTVLKTGYGSDHSQGITLLQSDLINGNQNNVDGVKYSTVSLNQLSSVDNGAYIQGNSGDTYQPYIHTESATVAYTQDIQKQEPYIPLNSYNSEFHQIGSAHEANDDTHKGLYNKQSSRSYYSNMQNNYNSGYNYNSNLQTGISHTLTAGAINVGLVGKTKLVDAGLDYPYNSDFNSGGHNNYYENINPGNQYSTANGYNSNIDHVQRVSTVITPDYSTATPIIYAGKSQKSQIGEIFGYTQPGVSLISPVDQFKISQAAVEVTNLNTPTPTSYKYETAPSEAKVDYQYYSSTTPKPNGQVQFSGYDYPKPSVAFEELVQKKVAYTTQEPLQLYTQPSLSTFTQASYYQPQPQIQLVKEEQAPVQLQYTVPSPVTVVKPNIYTEQIAQKPEPPQIYNQNDSPGIVHYSTPEQTYISQPQIYSHNIKQPEQEVQFNQYEYKRPDVELQEVPQAFVTTSSPVTQENFKPEILTDITYNKAENPIKQVEFTGYQYSQPTVVYNQVPIQTTAKPIKYQEQPQVYQQSILLHNEQPENSYPTTNTSSILQPQFYSQQTSHVLPQYTSQPIISQHQSADYYYQKPSVSINQNPFAKYVNPSPDFSIYKNLYQPQQVNYKQQSIVKQEVIPIIKQNEQYRPSVLQHEVNHQSYQFKSQYNQDNRYSNQGYVTNSPTNLGFSTNQQFTAQYKPIDISHQQAVVPEYNYKIEIPKPLQPIQKIVFNNEQPENIVESIHFSNQPVQYTTAKETRLEMNNEYLPPISKVPEYLPPVETVTETYLPPTQTTVYLPPSTTIRPATRKIYLPPVSSTKGYLPPTTTKDYSLPLPPKEYIPETANEYLPPSSAPEYLPPKVAIYKTTPKPTTVFVQTTTFRAPDYLPPEESEDNYYYDAKDFGLKENYKTVTEKKKISSTSVSPTSHRKQNIVVDNNENINLLGFGTVGPDAGLVSPPSYSTSSYSDQTEPITSRYVTKKVITTTYAPIKQEVEFTRRPTNRKQKIAVVTKINDFNPLLVRKLGAICSCKSPPIVVLKGIRGSPKDYTDYDYDNLIKIREEVELGKTVRITYEDNGYTKSLPKTTLNPIIVPDDSYYTDYSDETESEKVSSSSPRAEALIVTTEKIVKINPRARASYAPATRSVLSESSKAAKNSNYIETSNGKSLDRSGSGGWRTRGETLQASADCKRAGLFRHPKHCNKFYACRWDETKERFTLHVFNCPIQLSFDPNLGACNWPSQGPACESDTLLPSAV